MGSRTINTAMKERGEKGPKMKTSVRIQDFRDTDNACAIIFSPQEALDLANQLIVAVSVMEPKRLILTVQKNYEKSISLTEY